ncbi:MAG TPA: hypothetical protein VK986_13730 [Tepidisphaeraceae bacterium]|nr:hypothetical protein [Tepidisphaeraceae bacterium]
MNNGDSISTSETADLERRPVRTLTPIGPGRGGTPLLWKMLGVAVAAHLLIVLLTSKSLFGTDPDSPEQIYEKGERAMAAGQYLEAMEHYRRVLDMQPKVPPIFEKAAEQHRSADKQAKAKAAKVLTPATKEATEAEKAGAPASRPVGPTEGSKVKVTPAAPEVDLPPELRGK